MDGRSGLAQELTTSVYFIFAKNRHFIYNMSKIPLNKNNIDGTPKRVHTKVSDSSSDEEFMITKVKNIKTSKVVSLQT